MNPSEEIKKRILFISYVPYKLDPKRFQELSHLPLKDFPKYSCFPLNILFGNDYTRDQKHVFGSAFYKPDFGTYQEDEETKSMNYYNVHNRKWRVVIIYYKKRNAYEGSKYNLDTLVLNAAGKEWERFFVQLTMMGPSKGERCEFEEIK
jgi:hypothetical protein